ncbi:MAG: hypothetical protein O7C56_03855 [Rickettsia endosymbiont of Ixodes persulcatus]|nr:hypothetical protein [Rickettsia endosymbiont of Ixodes persulcatus]
MIGTNNKNLYAYDLEGTLVHHFTTFAEGAQTLGIPYTNIGKYILSGKA